MKRKHPILMVLLPLILTGCVHLPRDQVRLDRISDCPKQTAELLLSKQNELGQLTDTHTLSCALDFLRNTQDISLRRSTLGSRICLNLAERETDPDKRDKLAAEGVAFAETSIASGGEGDGAVHYYLAANLGLAVRDHLTLAMDSLARLEGEMKKAVALNPDIDDGGPLRLLGTLYIKAPAWPNGIGDRDKGLDLLTKAMTKFPGHPLNHLFYAEAILAVDDEDAAERAKAAFAQGEKLLAQGNWGYSRPSWEKEFDAFRDEIGVGPSISGQQPMAQSKK